jgi:hypothetical protein
MIFINSLYRWVKQINENNLDLLINNSKLQDGIKLKHIHKLKIKK